MKFHIFSTLATYLAAASAVSIAEINGLAFLSPYDKQTLTNVTGLVTAVGPSGFFLRDIAPSSRSRPKSPGSSAVYVFNSAAAKSVAVGDTIVIGSVKVEEFRQPKEKDNLFLTELTNPTNLTTVSTGNVVTTVVLGKRGLQLPTTQFSALDNGNIFSVPGGQSLISTTNATLSPTKYGLDFWESLCGELVSISSPVALGSNNGFGDVWVRGDWKVTGLNKAGGLTITQTAGVFDANPEAILIGSPLDKTKNPALKLGDILGPIEGVVTYAFGFYRILPKTAITIKTARTEVAPPTNITSRRSCKGVTIGQYSISPSPSPLILSSLTLLDVENLSPKSTHLNSIAAHIANYLKTPDLLFLQEIQDNSGPSNDDIVSGAETLHALSVAIFALSGISYSFLEIPPVDKLDGGQRGGNIRVAYFYNPTVFTLSPGTSGNATAAVEVLPGPTLSLNPGRIDPLNPAFIDSRKPLVAAFLATNATKPLFAINVHSGSKGGSTTIHGDSRPPVNGGVEKRVAQHESIAQFVGDVLAEDTNALIIAAGDFNEFSGVAPMRVFSGLLYDVDEVVGVKMEERYTYNFDMNSQQLDHTLVSAALRRRGRVLAYEHVHLNTWAQVETSDQ